MTYIAHITLTTGHARRSYREKIDDAVMPALRRLIAEMRDGKVVEIPGAAGYFARGYVGGRCMSCTVYAGASPLVTVGVATHSRCGAVLWRGLYGSAPAQARPEQPPAPWCGVVLHLDALAMYRDAMVWLGDFERCLAWAFVAEKSKTKG